MLTIQFDSLFKAIPPALMITPDPPVFTLVDANEAYYRATGSNPDEIIGKGLFETFPNNAELNITCADSVHSAIDWVMENKTPHFLPPQRYNLPVRGTQNFEKKYWVTSHSPVLDVNGELIYICQTMMDITSTIDLVTREGIALEIAEGKRIELYSLFMQAPVGIGVFLGDDYIVDLINPNMARLYGKNTEELLGKPIFKVISTVKGMGFEEFLDNVRLTGKPYVGIETMIPLIRDGAVENVFINFVCEPFRDENEKIIGIVAIAVDVTNEVLTTRKLQESEQRLNMALLNSESGVFDTDVITGITLHSLRNAQIFGYADNLEEWTIEKFMQHVHVDDRDRIRQEYRDSLESGNVDLTMRITRADGINRWINVIGKHIFDKNKRPVRCVGTTTDITDKKELEHQKDQFISMVSHELKTPLTSIKAYSELIGKSLIEGATKRNTEFLSRMHTQINRLEGLIKDLLDISRMENGKLVLNRSKFEMDVMLTELINDLQLANPSHTLTITKIDKSTVFADRDKLIQVITNLVSNAVKYSPNSPKINISLNCNKNQVICSIQDFGIGISQEKHTSVFERFHQVGDGQQFSGLGLGLYICKEIIHAEGGEIWLESSSGVGSIFYFTLPADQTICD